MRISPAVWITFLVVSVAATQVSAATIANGSLAGPSGQNQLPSGWQQYQGNSSDTADATGPFGTYNPSPDGGTFVRSLSWQKDTAPSLFNQREGLEQSVAGLIIGQLYRVSFYQTSVNGISSTSGQPFSGAPGYWSLLLDGSLADVSRLMPPPPGTGLDNQWSLESLFFQATAPTQLLSFLSTVPGSAAANTRTFMGIDGIVLASVPEPSITLLLGVSILAFARLARARPSPRR